MTRQEGAEEATRLMTFFPAARIDHAEAARHDVRHAAVVSPGSSPDTLSPVRLVLPAPAVLRRQRKRRQPAGVPLVAGDGMPARKEAPNGSRGAVTAHTTLGATDGSGVRGL